MRVSRLIWLYNTQPAQARGKDHWLDRVVLHLPLTPGFGFKNETSPSSTGLDHMTTASPPPPPCLTPQMHGLPPWLHHPVILFLLLFVLASSSASAVATTTIPTTAALPPPSPSAPSFQVPTPYGTLAYRVIEESRVLFLKLVTRARSSYISTTVGPVHVLRCIGKKGASLPPVVLVHGVCATGKQNGSKRTQRWMEGFDCDTGTHCYYHTA